MLVSAGIGGVHLTAPASALMSAQELVGHLLVFGFTLTHESLLTLGERPHAWVTAQEAANTLFFISTCCVIYQLSSQEFVADRGFVGL